MKDAICTQDTKEGSYFSEKSMLWQVNNIALLHITDTSSEEQGDGKNVHVH